MTKAIVIFKYSLGVKEFSFAVGKPRAGYSIAFSIRFLRLVETKKYKIYREGYYILKCEML